MNKITLGTIIRTVLLLLAVVNQVLAIVGKEALPVYESDVTQLITLAVTIAASIAAWWKNNSFTKAALAGDKVKETIKESRG